MRRNILASIGAAALLTALMLGVFNGCAGLKDADTARRMQSAAKVAAYTGTAEYLRLHPERRPAFEAARDNLANMENAETIDMAALLAIINQLPVNKLESEQATIIITATTLLLMDYLGEIPAQEMDDLKPLAKAIRGGIELGLSQTK